MSKELKEDAYSLKKKKGPAFKRKKKKKQAGAEGKTTGFTAGQLRVQKDLTELDLENTGTCSIAKKTGEWSSLTLIIKPDRGYWAGAKYKFSFKFPPNYPFEAPKVTCQNKIYHPNIDLEGHVCINVLRPWKPTYSTQTIVFGLIFLLDSPNPDDPLNKDAAKDMRENHERFGRHVKTSLRGGFVNGVSFPKNDG